MRKAASQYQMNGPAGILKYSESTFDSGLPYFLG